MANQFGKVSVGITATTGGLTTGLRQASTELSSFGQVANQLRNINLATSFLAFERAASMAVSTVRNLTGSLSGLVESSVSLGEEQSKSAVVFGQSAEQIGRFARAASAIGLSEQAALQATGTFGNLFRAIGLSEQQSAGFSVTMTSLAADLASFNNTTVDDALQALGAGLRGESEPLRRFGVLLDDATLRQQALAAGLVSSVKDALTPAQKAQAAYRAILAQTGTAQGDFQRTSGSLANQQRILSAEFENVRARIGEGLQPAFAAVVSAIRQSLPTVTALSEQFAAFVSTINVADLVTSVVNALVGLASSLMQVTTVLAPLLQTLIQPFVSALMFLANNATGAAAGLGVVVAGLVAYRAAALAASVANAGLAASFRALLASTGVGIIIALIGAAAGSLLDFALSEGDNGRVAAADLGKGFGDELRASTEELTRQLEASQTKTAEQVAQVAEQSAAGMKTVANVTASESTKAGDRIAQKIGVSSKALDAIVAGTSSGEAFRNAIARGADPRVVAEADRMIAMNTRRTADAVENLATDVGAAVGEQISQARISA